MRKLSGLLILLIALAGGAASCSTTDIQDAVPGAQPFGPLAGQSFGTGRDALVVLLHGDTSRGGPSDYLYEMADELAATNAGVTAVALLRPGYYDGEGRKSPGSNYGRRDNYTRKNNDLMAQTIQALKASSQPRRVIVMGHSGGAAQLGSVIGRYPGLVDSAVLVSCPCNITRWRAAQGARAKAPPRSQSPDRFISGIAPATRVIAITGANDRNTIPYLAEEYVQAATSAGLSATVTIVPGAAHDFAGALRSAAMLAVTQEIAR